MKANTLPEGTKKYWLTRCVVACVRLRDNRKSGYEIERINVRVVRIHRASLWGGGGERGGGGR